MPTAASVRLLCEEALEEGKAAPTVVWTPPAREGKSACAVWLAALIAVLMFLLGVCLGAFLNALHPDGGIPLGFLETEQLNSSELIMRNSSIIILPSNSTLVEDLEDQEDNVNAEKDDDNSIEITKGRDNSNEVTEKDENSGEEEPETTTEVEKRRSGPCPGFPWHDERLPESLRPVFYNLTIHPNATTSTIQGHVDISIEVEDETDQIVLHADRLTLEAFKVTVNGKSVESEHRECAAHGQWSFQLENELKKGDKVELSLDYDGQVLSDLQGLYQSTHTDKRGKKWKSMVTQFEPSYARRAFPCFDEPAMKAEFRISVVRRGTAVVRSNMNIKKSTQRSDGLYIDEFNPTVKMSTYLVAIAVLEGYDFARRVSRNTDRPIEVRIYAPKDVLKGQENFGLDTAIKAIEFFEDYFNISYPLEKIDLLALEDFSEGAMENWGLVTFRDSALLYAPNSSAIFREYIALVICHEVAHQWSGNLVTMAWWDDLWLNEGFANYMEYRCVDKIFPNWNIMTRFFVDNVVNSMELDGMPSSRAIASSEEGQPLINLFDAIAYHKAAAVIHMIQELASEKNFRRALIEYLNKFAYGNARGEELWHIVEKHAHLGDDISIKSLADAFTTQVGFPVISVHRDDDGVIRAGNQTRFFFDSTKSDEKSEWPLSIVFRTQAEEEPKQLWLKGSEAEVSIRPSPNNRWVVANSGGIGYFKVLYDEEIYDQLVEQLEDDHNEIADVDRTMILSDAYDLVKGARLNISVYLDLIKYAKKEDEKAVWVQISRQLKAIDQLVSETDFINIFKDFQRSLVLPAYEKFAWNSSTDPALNVELVFFACRLRIRDCTKRMQAAYSDLIRNKNRPPAELLGIVLDDGVRLGGETAFNRTLASLKEARGVTERQQLLSALTATQDMNLITRLMKLSLTANGPFRPSAMPRIMHYVTLNEAARPVVWRFFKLHFDEFNKILGKSTTLLMSCIRSIAERLSTQEELDELQSFLANKKNLHQGQAKLEQIYEQVRMNIQWRRLNEDGMRTWLEDWDSKRRLIQRA